MMKNSGQEIIIEKLNIPYCDKEINIHLKKELNYLRGNNGSGKTLLLDYIAGLRKNSKYTIRGNKSIIYINQNIFFSDRLKVNDFVNFVYRLDNRHMHCKNFIEFINYFIREDKELEKIATLMTMQWGMLSGGERKFLYTAILMSIDREWYILDEPFAYVDKSKKKVIWAMINQKIKDGKGIILTSHEDETIEKYANEIYI